MPLDTQRQPRLNRLHQILESDVFSPNRSSHATPSYEQAFAEVIQLLDDVLRQSDESGHRIDFINEVGVRGKIMDVTSLVGSMRRAIRLQTGAVASFEANQFNCYFNAGTGYFANGSFFDADHDDEVTFFVNDERIYLNRHIKRALQEAELAIVKSSAPSTNL
ncbi:hypothetical protein ACFSUS_17235 [Spirosoma soli]|uniref:Uncharacterized protein n=2 Tax=Spirosoma soli TaxID=1770529 RepID=A0ABW5M733_9BACT